MSYRGFHSEDEYHDALMEARREEYEDAHAPNMRCDECGHEWYSLILNTRSRVDPPEPEHPDCPNCEALAR